MKILVVDDDPRVGEYLQEVIRVIFGLECDYMSSPKKALETLAAGDYFLVISDYRMPEIDGLKFQEEVVRDFPNLSFALASGEVDITGEIRGECERRNIPFLQKPISHEKIAAVILLAKMPYSFPANY